jgi:hypothetical protein
MHWTCLKPRPSLKEGGTAGVSDAQGMVIGAGLRAVETVAFCFFEVRLGRKRKDEADDPMKVEDGFICKTPCGLWNL